jgi:spore maturation protein CgeD
MAKVSIIIVSHNKPSFVKDAIQSVLGQTLTDWEGVVMDSGMLLDSGFFRDVNDSRLRVMASGETPELARNRNMASWCFNKWLNSNSVSGELILYLCDDDLLYPEAFESFWNFYLSRNREPQAMYSSQDIGLVDSNGKTIVIGHRIADRPAGRFCHGKRLDCKVDYLQFCHSKAVLDRMEQVYKTREYHSENKRDAPHADGIFMEQIGALTKVHNIEKILSMNRRTAQSVNAEYSSSRLGRSLITLKAKIRGTFMRLSSERPY